MEDKEIKKLQITRLKSVVDSQLKQAKILKKRGILTLVDLRGTDYCPHSKKSVIPNYYARPGCPDCSRFDRLNAVPSLRCRDSGGRY